MSRRLSFLMRLREEPHVTKEKRVKKMMEELATLCGVDVCTIIHCSELNPQLEFWPSKSEAQREVVQFQSLSPREQTRNMLDIQKVTRKKIAKAEEKLQKLVTANRLKELNKVMFDCLAGRSQLQSLVFEDLDGLERVVDGKLGNIQKKIEALLLNHPGQMGASTSNAGAMTGRAARN